MPWFRHGLLALSSCLHDFATATRIPAVASPTEMAKYHIPSYPTLFQLPCQYPKKFFTASQVLPAHAFNSASASSTFEYRLTEESFTLAMRLEMFHIRCNCLPTFAPALCLLASRQVLLAAIFHGLSFSLSSLHCSSLHSHSSQLHS